MSVPEQNSTKRGELSKRLHYALRPSTISLRSHLDFSSLLKLDKNAGLCCPSRKLGKKKVLAVSYTAPVILQHDCFIPAFGWNTNGVQLESTHTPHWSPIPTRSHVHNCNVIHSNSSLITAFELLLRRQRSEYERRQMAAWSPLDFIT